MSKQQEIIKCKVCDNRAIFEVESTETKQKIYLCKNCYITFKQEQSMIELPREHYEKEVEKEIAQNKNE